MSSAKLNQDNYLLTNSLNGKVKLKKKIDWLTWLPTIYATLTAGAAFVAGYYFESQPFLALLPGFLVVQLALLALVTKKWR